MKDTKMSISTTYAKIVKVETVEQILNRVKSTEFKTQVDKLRKIVKEKGKEANRLVVS